MMKRGRDLNQPFGERSFPALRLRATQIPSAHAPARGRANDCKEDHCRTALCFSRRVVESRPFGKRHQEDHPARYRSWWDGGTAEYKEKRQGGDPDFTT